MSSKEGCSFSFFLNLLGLESRMTGVMMSAGAGAESVLRKSNARTKDNIVLALLPVSRSQERRQGPGESDITQSGQVSQPRSPPESTRQVNI